MKTFNSWEEACEASERRQAVAPIRIVKDARTLTAEVVMKHTGEANICWKHTVIPIRKANTHEIDGIRSWKPF